MRNKYLITSLLALCLNAFIFVSRSFAVEDQQELYPTIVIKEKPPSRTVEKAEKLKMDFSASVTGGYDSNVKLEHYDPVSSFFAQNAFGARAKYSLTDIFALRGRYDVTWIKYFRFSDSDLLDNMLRTGLDAKLAENIIWSMDYILDFVEFPFDEESEYIMNEAETSLRHELTDRLYQKLIYRFSHRQYHEWKTRNRNGTFRLGDRKDARNTFEHQLGAYLADKTFIRTDNTLYFNDSNEAFLDYYDYKSVKTRESIVYLITDRLYASANIAYQYKSYNNRIVSDQVHGDQRDHLLMGGTSLFYDINPSVSLGTSFDFRKNFSNEGAQRYTDYIISSGAYCRF